MATRLTFRVHDVDKTDVRVAFELDLGGQPSLGDRLEQRFFRTAA